MSELIKELEKRGYIVDYKKDEWLNISQPGGMNCEFYPCDGDTILSATYTIGGVKTDINHDVELDGNERFLEYVNELLRGEAA